MCTHVPVSTARQPRFRYLASKLSPQALQYVACPQGRQHLRMFFQRQGKAPLRRPRQPSHPAGPSADNLAQFPANSTMSTCRCRPQSRMPHVGQNPRLCPHSVPHSLMRMPSNMFSVHAQPAANQPGVGTASPHAPAAHGTA